MKPIEEKTDILQLKKEIRKKTLSMRDGISLADRTRCDEKIGEAVICMAEYREAETILAYANYRSEVGTTGLMKQALTEGKTVFVPKVSGEEMEFWQITDIEDLHKGYKGIREPLQTTSFPEWLMKNRIAGQYNKGAVKVMMWMPGAVFDRERRRIGYGGGFYDRYLERMADWKLNKTYEQRVTFDLSTAALAYDCQVLERIPYEQHDIRPDRVVTEIRIY